MTSQSAVVDVVVVGAGIIGAACAYYLTQAGARVMVLDAGPVAGGTSSAGEGHLLVSDKPPGPQLTLALAGRRRWDQLGSALGVDDIELAEPGGLRVASSAAARDRLSGLLAGQRAAGVTAVELTGDELVRREPRLARGLAGGAYYPQDARVQPMLAAVRLLAASGADVRAGVRVRSIERTADGAAAGVRVAGSLIRAGAVVNAAGAAAGEVAASIGTYLPIAPRRGFGLVTEPLTGPAEAPLIRHQVYAAEYTDGAVSDDAGLWSAAVVEATRAGAVLIGASRERVHPGGWYPLPVLRRLAAQAVALFPFLASVQVLRAYRGFRPFTPDHLPVIGADPQVAGVWHATGHEGAGIGLAPATGALIADLVTGAAPELDPAPFDPGRFA